VHLITGAVTRSRRETGISPTMMRAIAAPRSMPPLLQRTWTAPAPFEHQGEFYRVVGAYADIRCQQVPHMPIYGGGGSPAAMRALAPVVDVYMLWGSRSRPLPRLWRRCVL